jgi:hypothetical protein
MIIFRNSVELALFYEKSLFLAGSFPFNAIK